MSKYEWGILTAIIIGGWILLYSGYYEMALNCFLAVAVIIILKK